MISRFALRCGGCEQPFLLRLEVAPTELTNFAVACPHCDYLLRASYRGMELGDIRFSWGDATLVSEDDLVSEGAVVTAGTITPVLPRARTLHEWGGGPNAVFGRLVGSNHTWANEGHGRLQGQVELWRKYDRLLHYYANENWPLFNEGLKGLFGDDVAVPLDAQQRHIAALHPAQLLLLPMLPPDGEASRLMNPFLDAIRNHAHNPVLERWSLSLEQSGLLKELQGTLFEQLQLFIRQWEAWAPGFIVRATQEDRRDLLTELRIARDDFPLLRDMYIQVFENCCRTLWLAMGAMNTEMRSDPDAFGLVPEAILNHNAKAVKPSSLKAFEGLPNATKIRWLKDWPAWAELLPRLLDNKLRNALGHADVRHDIPGGLIASHSLTISYLDFTARVFDLAKPLLVLLQVVKSLRLVAADHLDRN
jgi:hypothetical protein